MGNKIMDFFSALFFVALIGFIIFLMSYFIVLLLTKIN